MSSINSFPDIINGVARGFDDESDKRLLVQSQTGNDESVSAGNQYNCEQIFEIDIDTPLYLLFENPSNSGVDVNLIKRFFKTDSDGADLLIYWDYDVSTATKTPLTIFNENNNYRDKYSLVEINVLNPITVDSSTGVATLTDAATIVDAGIIRESSFIPSTGVGSNQSGDIEESTGVRIYAESTGFLIKVTSRGNGNLTSVGYTFQEETI